MSIPKNLSDTIARFKPNELEFYNKTLNKLLKTDKPYLTRKTIDALCIDFTEIYSREIESSTDVIAKIDKVRDEIIKFLASNNSYKFKIEPEPNDWYNEYSPYELKISVIKEEIEPDDKFKNRIISQAITLTTEYIKTQRPSYQKKIKREIKALEKKLTDYRKLVNND